MNNYIKLEELEDFSFTKSIAVSASSDYYKKWQVIVTPAKNDIRYQIVVNNSVIYTGPEYLSALNSYNNC